LFQKPRLIPAFSGWHGTGLKHFLKVEVMTMGSRIGVLLLCAVMLSGCEDMTRQQQRTLSGGAIGAAGGAVITAIVGGPVLLGTAIGAGVGAVAGAVTH